MTVNTMHTNNTRLSFKKRRIITLALLALLVPIKTAFAVADIQPTRLRCEYLENPLGIDSTIPRLSWIVTSTDTNRGGQRQTAYQVLVASSREKLARDDGDLWDSGRVESDETIQINYAGKKLRTGQACHWKIRAWDRNGQASGWSDPALWTMGLLKTSDWAAKWIAYRHSSSPPTTKRPEPWLRKTVALKGKPERAFAYVCSLGYHELYVNGRKVGDALLSPGVSQLNKRALYVTYDITSYLVEGKNAIGLWLGYGWFRPGVAGVFHKSPVVKAQLEWSLPDGAQGRMVTDETWRGNPSPLRWIGPRGELYDATREIDDWGKPEYDDASWSRAEVVSAPPIAVSAQKMQPNRIAREIHPVAVKKLSPGVYEIDMGRNYVGYFQLRLRDAARGDRIDMEMNELKVSSGLKQSYGQNDAYIAKGADGEIFRNRFDYRAFRQVTIRGLKQPPILADARGFMIHADLCSTATFECSNDLLNRIQRTVDWTYRCTSMGGNIVDCPHRERLGYGAEGQTTMLTAMTHSDAAAMFTHWLEVWRDLQNPATGMMSHTAPSSDYPGSPGWGGICVTLPWELYVRYGDRRILQQSYPSVRLWINFLNSKSKDHILRHYGHKSWGFYADWVAPGRQLVGRWTNAVPKECDMLFNNCYFIHNVELAAKIARVLGKEDDARQYEEQAQLQRQAVHAKYYDPVRNVYVNGEQAYQVMALMTCVIPAERRESLSRLLTLLITEARKGHLNTGVLGTFFMFQHLLHENRNDLVFQMVNQRTYPGWGWLLDNGATTIGEQWGGGASQIHSSFLSVNSWFIEGIGGIQVDPVEPGYKHIIIRPAVVGDLTWAKASYDSIRGPIVTDWNQADNQFLLHVVIPANTTATVHVPAKNAESVREGGCPASKALGVTFLRMEDGAAVYEVTSGRYNFRSDK